MGYPRKNPNIGNWVYTFLKKNAGILEFAALPFKILEKKKQAFTLWNSAESCVYY